jgi:hypothetical protein
MKPDDSRIWSSNSVIDAPLERVGKIWPLTTSAATNLDIRGADDQPQTGGQSATEWPCGSADMPRSCVTDQQVGNADHQQRRPEPAQALRPEPARGAIRTED